MQSLLPALLSARRPVALTGAGISAPSGVPTFQSTWKGAPIRDFLSRSYFRAHRVDFFELFCQMEQWCHAEPNRAHRMLAEHGVPIITQNIDGLHQKAGSNRVLEMHGNLCNIRCPRCGAVTSAEALCAVLRPLYQAGDRAAVEACLTCACGGLLDIDVVLYEDPVRLLDEAIALVSSCDVLLVVGTSLQVYPAASLPDIARRAGARVLIENTDCIAALTP